MPVTLPEYLNCTVTEFGHGLLAVACPAERAASIRRRFAPRSAIERVLCIVNICQWKIGKLNLFALRAIIRFVPVTQPEYLNAIVKERALYSHFKFARITHHRPGHLGRARTALRGTTVRVPHKDGDLPLQVFSARARATKVFGLPC